MTKTTDLLVLTPMLEPYRAVVNDTQEHRNYIEGSSKSSISSHPIPLACLRSHPFRIDKTLLAFLVILVFLLPMISAYFFGPAERLGKDLLEAMSYRCTQHRIRNETPVSVLFCAVVTSYWLQNLHRTHHTYGNPETLSDFHNKDLQAMVAEIKRHVLPGQIQNASQLLAFATCMLHAAGGFDNQMGEAS